MRVPLEETELGLQDLPPKFFPQDSSIVLQFHEVKRMTRQGQYLWDAVFT